MAYSKQTWANDAGGGTPLSATRLNYMEDGIEDAHSEAVIVAGIDGATLTDVGTPASGDLILLQDASDGNSLKAAQFSTFGGSSGGLTELFIGASSFGDNGLGTAGHTDVSRHDVWSLGTGNSGLGANVKVPTDWSTMHIDLYWCNGGAGSGDVVLDARPASIAAGVTLANPSDSSSVTVTAGAQNVIVETRLRTGYTVPGDAFQLNIVKLASGETLANGILVLGALLTKAS